MSEGSARKKARGSSLLWRSDSYMIGLIERVEMKVGKLRVPIENFVYDSLESKNKQQKNK